MNETVKIVNMLQMAKYMKHDVKPIDMFFDHDTDKVVYVFDKEETKPLFDLWIRRQLV